MTIDIVDRLRAPDGDVVSDSHIIGAARFAADEIERLRVVSEVAHRMADILNRMTQEHDLSDCYSMAVDALDLYTEAAQKEGDT